MEEWKDIKNYEGLYQVSNLGNVRSLDRYILKKDGNKQFCKGIILKNDIDNKNYANVRLCDKNKKHRVYKVHRLVAQEFIGGLEDFDYDSNTNSVVNHKNHNTNDNRLENLEIVNIRENTSYQKRRDNFSSKYTGVSYHKKNKKWMAQIQYKKQLYFLGYYEKEDDAYKSVLNKYDELGIKNCYVK